MKAIVVHQFGAPEVLKYEDAPDPKPGLGQVLVRVKAAGVNPVDTYVRAGWYGPKDFPYTPGNDAAGNVDAVGPGVTRVKVGDRVYTAATISGSYAELTLADQNSVHPLPANVPFPQGAAVGVAYGTAYHALFHRGQPKEEETVLVHGASGGVGIAAIQLARTANLKVFGTAGSEQGLTLVREQGAHQIFNHHEKDYTDKIMAATNGRGVDLILEMLANVNLDKDLKMLAPRGRVMVIGSRGRIEIDPRDTMRRASDIRGIMLGTATIEQKAAMHQQIVQGLEKGQLNPIVGKELPLRDAPKAHVEVIEGPAHGKIVLVP